MNPFRISSIYLDYQTEEKGPKIFSISTEDDRKKEPTNFSFFRITYDAEISVMRACV